MALLTGSCYKLDYIKDTNLDYEFQVFKVLTNKEGSVLFNDALNTFSYSYMASDIW